MHERAVMWCAVVPPPPAAHQVSEAGSAEVLQPPTRIAQFGPRAACTTRRPGHRTQWNTQIKQRLESGSSKAGCPGHLGKPLFSLRSLEKV